MANEPSPATWYSGVRSALGYRFEIWVTRERDLARTFAALLQDLPPASAEDGPVDRYDVVRHDRSASFGLYLKGECLAAGEIGAHFSSAWTWNLNRAAIAAGSRSYVVLHAACVTRAGVTVILPAEMESGKSTTTAGLLRAGFDYVTDEATALVPESGEVMPYPKPLSLDPGSWPLFPELAHQHEGQHQWSVTARSLGARALTTLAPRPRAVVFPKYRHGVETRIESCMPAETLFELCRMTFNFAESPRRIMAALAQLTDASMCVRLTIGDLSAAVGAIEEVVSTSILEDM